MIRSIEDIFKSLRKRSPAEKKWEAHALLAIWYQLFPVCESHVEKCFLKQRTLFIKLDSIVLTAQMRRNSQHALRCFNEALQQQSDYVERLDKIVFL